MYKLSPSALNLFNECPRCFWLLHNKHIRRPDTIFPSLPSGMDRLLKQHFDHYTDLNQLPPELGQLKDVTLFKDKNLLSKWRDNKQGLRFIDKDGNQLTGAIDALLQKGSKLIVLDYKTRGYPIKKDSHTYYYDQINLYNFLIRKNNHQTENYSYLLFYHPDKIVGSVFHFHTDLVKLEVDIKKAETLWHDALVLLTSALPQPAPGCSFCKYKSTKIQPSLLEY